MNISWQSSVVCARYSKVGESITITIGDFEVTINVAARFNIAPTQRAPVIRWKQKEPKAEEMFWGWKRTDGGLLVNAKSETMQQLFHRYAHQRCLIPADGFYEWTADKTPIRFMHRDNDPFCFAGLWRDVKTQPADEVITQRHFVILTRAPVAPVNRFHDRMPFVVRPDFYERWLCDDVMVSAILGLPDETLFGFMPVQRALNSVANEGPELIRPGLMQAEMF